MKKPSKVYLLHLEHGNQWVAYKTLKEVKSSAYAEDVYVAKPVKVGRFTDDNLKFIPIKRRKKS